MGMVGSFGGGMGRGNARRSRQVPTVSSQAVALGARTRHCAVQDANKSRELIIAPRRALHSAWIDGHWQITKHSPQSAVGMQLLGVEVSSIGVLGS